MWCAAYLVHSNFPISKVTIFLISASWMSSQWFVVFGSFRRLRHYLKGADSYMIESVSVKSERLWWLACFLPLPRASLAWLLLPLSLYWSLQHAVHACNLGSQWRVSLYDDKKVRLLASLHHSANTSYVTLIYGKFICPLSVSLRNVLFHLRVPSSLGKSERLNSRKQGNWLLLGSG